MISNARSNKSVRHAVGADDLVSKNTSQPSERYNYHMHIRADAELEGHCVSRHGKFYRFELQDVARKSNGKCRDR